jgi:tetratricopeptide (TPR) repeat protein
MDTKPVQSIVPWAALGISIVALIFSLLAWLDRSGGAAQPVGTPLSPPLSAPFSASGTSSADLASMPPRDAADRLFNRVMTASESGNTAEAMQFAPMALQAYDRVGPLDNDARYHVALIHLVAGDVKSAQAQLEQLRRSVPNHLLALMLAHQIAVQSGDKAGAARAYKNFLAAYDAEMATARVEYQEHRGGIERFRAAAQASAAAKK